MIPVINEAEKTHVGCTLTRLIAIYDLYQFPGIRCRLLLALKLSVCKLLLTYPGCDKKHLYKKCIKDYMPHNSNYYL
ncbi:MAG: hypothetical protein JWQ30_1083 [Sediminibacterium sp.]|nr:hypothetical protein [Sediminibacterium sp.]